MKFVTRLQNAELYRFSEERWSQLVKAAAMSTCYVFLTSLTCRLRTQNLLDIVCGQSVAEVTLQQRVCTTNVLRAHEV